MNIGFVGLGAMGAGIVPRLMAAGHTVTGWNRSKEKAEPLIAPSPTKPMFMRPPRKLSRVMMMPSGRKG